jgi:6-pyruvoyltetrahydropterin/6-carboxytetrahydropterin synthase
MKVGIFDYMDCAHHLPGIDKGEVHGHTYKVEVIVQGKFDGKMLVDFKTLRHSAREAMALFDHKNANDVLAYPSTENICLALFQTLKKKESRLVQIRLWEGGSKWAEMTADDPGAEGDPGWTKQVDGRQ